MKRARSIIFLVSLIVITGFLFVGKLSLPAKPPLQHDDKKIFLIVMPHHDLLLEYYPAFYRQLSTRAQHIEQIIVLSPNHFHADFPTIVTHRQQLQIHEQQPVAFNDQLGLDFYKRNLVVFQDGFFSAEHGINIHLPFIVSNFSSIPVTGFLFTRNNKREELDAFADFMFEKINQKNSLIIVSSDFSHYLPLEIAENHDLQTLQFINSNQADEIYSLSDDYVDCSSCLYIVTLLSDRLGLGRGEVLFHSNSARIKNDLHLSETTSYFAISWMSN